MKHIHFFWLPGLALMIFSACSCSTEGNIQQILGSSVEAPVFLDCRPVSSTELVFSFSQPVRVVSLNFDPAFESGVIEEGREVKVAFTEPPQEGRKITADILVEDSGKNTLNVIVPFRARNDRIPAMVFNEIRAENNKTKAEFVEFLTLEPGNLGALRFFSAYHSLAKPVYEFPPVEVEAGQYIVLHLRATEESCVDETGTDRGLSGGVDANNEARDLWIHGNNKLIDPTDALWLLDQDDRMIDAVLLSEAPDTGWGKKYMPAAVEYLGRNNTWPGGNSAGGENGRALSPADAVFTGYTSPTRTICRDDDTVPPARGPAAWYITVNSGNSAGGKNNMKRYTP